MLGLWLSSYPYMLWMPLMNIIKKKMDSLYSNRLVCNLFNLSDWWKLLGTIHDIRHCPNFLKPLPPLEHPRALRFLDFRLSIFSKPSPPPLLGRPLCMVPYMNYIYIWYYLILFKIVYIHQGRGMQLVWYTMAVGTWWYRKIFFWITVST